MKIQTKTKKQDQLIYLMKRDNDIILKGAFSLPDLSQQHRADSCSEVVREPGSVRRAFPDVILLHNALLEPSTVSSIPDPDYRLSDMWSLWGLKRKDPVCGWSNIAFWEQKKVAWSCLVASLIPRQCYLKKIILEATTFSPFLKDSGKPRTINRKKFSGHLLGQHGW